MIVQRFNLNLIPNQSPVVVHVNQYDTGTGRLIATLYEGNEPYSPNGTAVIQGTKPDGHGFQYTATLDGNVVTADLTEQMAPVAGDVRAQIVVTESSGATGTFVFIMRVQPSALPSDADMSESDYPLIEEAIREAQEAVIDSHDNAENSEAWAQGTRGGIPVGPTDPTYEHNAEYWAHQAEGAASGVSSFNGRSGSVLPMAGDYDSEKILLASALHIGGETQNNVQEALEALVDDGGAGHTILNGLGQEMPQRKNLRFAGANLSDDAQNDTTNVTITGGSGGSTITVTTIETTLYGETATITDGTSTFTGVFDNSGVCVIDGVTATGTLTVSSGAASRTLNVPYFGNYTVALSFWAATINVSTDPDVVSAIVKKDGVQIDTISFSAGSGVYIADSTGAYTFTATVGGIDFTSPTVNVTQQTTYSTVIDIFNATLSISTSSSELYGKTITIKKGSTTVGTTAFSAQGSASYTVHETGTYTCECEGYSGSATVSAETTYNVTINAGLDLSAWISAGSTTEYPLNPSSYADFSALEADEAAVRQLMTVHASVDYLAQATAGDSLMESVIGSDVCAKWINLSDYALDTLYANSDIADVMDTADKYFYGEWGKIDSTTWGALGNVPIMTANNAPYGVASRNSVTGSNEAYKAFSGSATATDRWLPNTNDTNNYLRYTFVNPVKAKKAKINFRHSPSLPQMTFSIRASNDGFTTYDTVGTVTVEAQSSAGNVEVEVDLTSNTYYMAYDLFCSTAMTITSYDIGVHSLQFYGRELKPLVPTMTADDKPKGTVTYSSQYDTSNYPAWKAFNESQSNGWSVSGSDTFANNYIAYEFDEPQLLDKCAFWWTSGSSYRASATAKIYGSENGTDFTEIGTVTAIQNTGKNIIDIIKGYYKAIKCNIASKAAIDSSASTVLQSGNGYKFQFYGMDYSEKEFAQGSTRKTIYDHGVAPNGINLIAGSTGGTPVDDGNQITVTSPNSAALSNYSLIQSNEAVNMGDYDYMHVRYGNRFVYDASNRFHLGAWKTKMTGQNYANTDIDLNIDLMTAIPLTSLEDVLDITQISASEYPAYYASYTRAEVTASINELWLE